MVYTEQDLIGRGKYFCGVDEVGRGPLAGPVVACACLIKITKTNLQTLLNLKVTDSKKLSSAQRKLILEMLKIDSNKYQGEFSLGSFALGLVEHDEIDRLNIHYASLKAMEIAVRQLNIKSEKTHLFFDGKFIPFCFSDNPNAQFLVKGDSKSLVIGLASIIAKVYRDELMASYGEKFPAYGFEKHAGYGTKLHRFTLLKKGPCGIHRRTFKGVKELIEHQ